MPDTKLCLSCGQVKHMDFDFSYTPSGRPKGKCKECYAAQQREYYKKNKARENARSRRWRRRMKVDSND
jgi:hypothetical protein